MNVSYYAIIPANVRYDKDLTPNAKLIYGEITALCNQHGYCYAKNEYFSDLYQVSKTSVSKWISQLINKGYIKSSLKYYPNSKEVEERHLTIITTPIEEKLKGGIEEKLKGGIEEKLKDNKENNTSNNNTGVKSKNDFTQERQVLNKVAHLFNPKFYKGNEIKWMDEIRKLISLDKESPQDIIQVISFGRNDEFWKDNFLSVLGLRKKKDGITKYDKMKARMPQSKKAQFAIYKNGIKSANEDDIKRMLGDEYTYQKNVIENGFEYVDFESGVYKVRKDGETKFIVTSKGRIEL